MLRLMLIALLVFFGEPALAAELRITVQIPTIEVAEYHRPYVALWIEKPDQSVVADLAVWYDVVRDGTDWLADLRQWWRRSGRNQRHPVDLISGASKPVGVHELVFDSKQPQLAKLTPGEYGLVVEAAREVGGRELTRIPFTWPGTAPQKLEARGQRELGKVTLEVKP